MGLSSFLKDKGKAIFGKKEKEVTESVKLTKLEQLKAEIDRLGIPINDLHLELCEQVIVEGATDTTEQAEKIVLALGNIEGIGSVANNICVANPVPDAVFHTVEEGDLLSKISKKVYGDPMKYEQIFEANKPMLSHPDKIYLGQVLRIPQ